MKANELRIGNLVFDGKEIVKVNSRMIYMLENNQAEFDVVPLVEERLLKFGFQQNIGIASREFLIDGTIKVINHYENGFLFTTNFWMGGVFIKNVHQLKNLYFALTGEELVAKA